MISQKGATMNGGYKIIDFKKVALSSTRTAIEGIMEDLTENNGKVVLLTNVVIGETEMDDCFSTVIVKSDQSIKLNCYDGYISINTSGVKYTSASVENLAEDIEDLQTTEELYSASTVWVYKNNKTIICTFSNGKIADIITALADVPKPSGTFRNAVWNETDNKAAVVSITSNSVVFLDTNPWGAISDTTKTLQGQIAWIVE